MKRLIVTALVLAGLWAGEGFGQVDSIWSRQFAFDDFVWAKDVSEINDGRIFIVVNANHWEEHQGQVNDRTEILILDSLGNDINQIWVEYVDASLTFDNHFIIKGLGDIKCLTYDDRTLFDIDLPQDVAGFDCQKMLSGEDSVLFMAGARNGLPTVAKIDLSNGNYAQREIAYLDQGIAMLGGFKSFVRSSESELIAVGNTQPDSGNWENQDIWIACFNNDLEVLWSKRYGTNNFDQGLDIIKTVEDCFMIAGGMNETRGSGHGLLLKIDSNGDSLWADSYECRSLHSIVQNDSGKYVAVGTTGPMNDPAVLLEVSEIGELLFSRSVGIRDVCQTFTQIILTSEGTYLVIGQGSGFANKSILIEFVEPNTVRNDGRFLSPVEIQLSAYPNPFNSTLNISFGVGARHAVPLQIAVFDPLGRRVAELIPGVGLGDQTYAGSQHIVWNAEGLPAGKYVIYLEAGSSRAAKAVTLLK